MAFAKFDKEEPQQDHYGHLMCKAHNCPNRWSVDLGGGGLCSRHAWADPSKWGEVTREMAAQSSYGTSAQEIKALTQSEKVEILRRLQDIGRQPSRIWAEALKERESRGERLTSFQKASWREALGVRDVV